MDYELILPILAVLLLIFDLFQLSRSKSKQKLSWSFYATTSAFVLMLIAYAVLVVGFATDNFSLTEVYTYSSSSLSLVSKICASWAGSAGSILFLTLIIMTTYFAYRFATRKNLTPTGVAASQILCVLSIFFVIMGIGRSPFTHLATVAPDGAGLNPALQTVWMQTHPPIVFIGYAFVLLAFALSIGGMKTRELAESRLLKVSAGMAWLMMTIGIASGGVWAYEVLGWGGYWSWDPVETGSLLVWLAITAYFFVRPLAETGKNLVREFTLFVAFAALIFLSALTRGGLLHSVHAYALSPAGPILIGLALGFAAYFVYLQRKIGKPLFQLNIDKTSVRRVYLAVGYVALAALFLGSFLGIAVPMIEQLYTSEPLTPGSAFYNGWSFPFAALLVVTMVGFALHDKLKIKAIAAIAVGSIVAGAVLVVAGWPTSDFLANLGVPLLVVGLIFVSYDLAKTVSKKERTIKAFGRKLLFLGMILGLFGILFSAATKQTNSLSNVQFNSDGVATAQVQGLSIVLSNWRAYGGEGQVYSADLDSTVPEHSSIMVNVEVTQNGIVYRDSATTVLYTNYGPMAVPLVIHTLQGDIYLHLDVTDPVYNSLLQALMGIGSSAPLEVSLTVSTVPLVYLLWIGVILMCVGITLIAVDDAKKPSEPAQNDFF
jgi:cytochrome c-type biogenesis protein CcmF